MHYVILFIMSLLALYASKISWSILKAMEERGRKSQVDLGFHSQKIIQDLNILYYSGLVLLAGFIWVTLGSWGSTKTVQTVGEMAVLVFFLFLIVVLNRWDKRLKK